MVCSSGYLENDAGRSRIYAQKNDAKPLRPLEVFEKVHQRQQPAAEAWFNRLNAVPWDQFVTAIGCVPSTTMTIPARVFAARLLELNREALLTRSFRHA